MRMYMGMLIWPSCAAVNLIVTSIDPPAGTMLRGGSAKYSPMVLSMGWAGTTSHLAGRLEGLSTLIVCTLDVVCCELRGEEGREGGDAAQAGCATCSYV